MLTHISLFSDLSNQELDYLSRIVTEVNVKRGETIFSQGDATRDFYVIRHGQVEIAVKDVFHERKVVNILKNGEFFGEMSLFDKDSARSASAVAFQNTSLIKIPGNEFERLLKEQPSISYKLLGTMSKRLKEFLNPTQERAERTISKRAKIITIGSPRDGYGKTTFAVTLAQLISTELPKKVLLLDLDLSFGDATFLSGVYSPRSILDLVPHADPEGIPEDTINKYAVKKSATLTVMPAPKDLVDAERMKAEDLVTIINGCRRHYDYIIIDTHSAVSDLLLNALDMADHILFLINVRDSIAVKSHALFFQAVSRMNLPDSHIYLLASHLNGGHNLDQARKISRWPIIGEIPVIPDFKHEPTEMPYLVQGSGPYSVLARELVVNLLKEDSLKNISEPGLLSRLFSSATPPGKTQTTGLEPHVSPNGPFDLPIQEEVCAPMLKEIRNKLSRGFLNQAQEDCYSLITVSPGSVPVLQVLGEIFFMKRDFGHALDVFERVIGLDPENFIALGHLARIRGDDKLKQRAIKNLSERIKQNPGFPDLLNEMGKLLMGFGNFEEAKEYFDKALLGNFEYVDAHINLSLALGELGRDQEAIARLMDIRQKNVKVFYLLGNFFYKTNQFFEAMTAYTRVSEINPHYCDTDEHLESLRSYFAKLNNLVEMHKRLAKESPDYPDIHAKLGNLYLLVGNRELAQQEYLEALRLKPDYREALEKIEELKSDQGRHIGKMLEEGQMSEQTVEAKGGSTPSPSPETSAQVSRQDASSL